MLVVVKFKVKLNNHKKIMNNLLNKILNPFKNKLHFKIYKILIKTMIKDLLILKFKFKSKKTLLKKI